MTCVELSHSHIHVRAPFHRDGRRYPAGLVLPASPYYLGFTAVSLRPELARIIAEAFLASGDWQLARAKVLAENSLQSKSASSTKRVERELRQRLQTLTPLQLETLANSTADDRVAMAWLATIKFSAFPYEFAADVLREKLATHDEVLRPSDYELFVDQRRSDHPELATLAATTRTKIKVVLLRMLSEVGILAPGPLFGSVQRPILSPTAERPFARTMRTILPDFLCPTER